MNHLLEKQQVLVLHQSNMTKRRYEHKYEYCDLLIAGSGPSGLAGAYAAAKNGARVILAEDKPRFGGSLLTSEVNIGNQTGKEWADQHYN